MQMILFLPHQGPACIGACLCHDLVQTDIAYLCPMQKNKTEWQTLLDILTEKFGMEPDLQSVLFLIGVQELGMGYKKFKKDEKLNVLHIAICTVLEPYGYYEFEGRDKDGWPHFKIKEPLPFLKAAEQNNLMIKAVIEYFKKEGVIPSN